MEERTALLADLGIQFEINKDKRSFSKVLIPLSPDEWCSICQADGKYYIKNCCPSANQIQDKIIDIFRYNSGWASYKDIAEIAALKHEHESHNTHPVDEMTFKNLPLPLAEIVLRAKKHWDIVNPWKKLTIIWHIIRL